MSFPEKEALILPSLGRTDIDIQNEAKQFVTVRRFYGCRPPKVSVILNFSSDSMLSEPEIIVRIAKATLQMETESIGINA